MRRFKLLLASAGFALATGLFLPILASSTAYAAVCTENQLCQPTTIEDPCFRDLGLNKQVKVPDGSFIDAHTVGNAPSATVGSTVEWQITVSDLSTGISYNPDSEFNCFDVGGGGVLGGKIVVKDVLPAGFTFQSSTQDGTYNSATGEWTFDAGIFSSVPNPTLTLVTTATQSGNFQNIATLDHLVLRGEPPDTFPTPYDVHVSDNYSNIKDQNNVNDSSNAWVTIQSDPQVLGASTLGAPNTGFGKPAASNTAAVLLISLGLIGLVIAFLRRKKLV